MRAVIHIGFPKTGTSSIQNYCSQNAARLLGQGVLWARTGRILSFQDRARHMGLRFAFEPMDSAPTRLMRIYGLEKPWRRGLFSRRFLAKLDKELAAHSTAQTVFFSAEELSGTRDNAMVQNLHDAFKTRFDSVQVFCIIREPFSYLASSYSQNVKIGRTPSWSEMLDTQRGNTLFLSQIRRWQEVFGDENVIVQPLKGNALEQITPVLGCDIEIDRHAGHNAGLSTAGIKLLHQLNNIYAKAGRKRPAKIRKAFEKHMTGSPWRPDIDQVNVVYDMVAPELDELRKLCAFSKDDLDYLTENWSAENMRNNIESQPAPEDDTGLLHLLMDAFE